MEMELVLLLGLTLIGLVVGLDNGLALTPPMGWSSWNHFHRGYDETVFTQTADAMVANGMKDAGYTYINIDGGWWDGSDTGKITRNSTGYVVANKKKFPSGIETMIAYVHSKGLKYGHYTDAGKKACNGDAPMSEGFEHQDATLFAEWGIDMIKVDACATTEKPQVLMKRWQKELNQTGRPILFSNCRNACLSNNWEPWCETENNMWRTSGDIGANWHSIMKNLDTLKGRGKYGKPGSWNDPDFLEVGNGKLSLVENRAHFTMWCITSSPLITGNDIRKGKVSDDILSILTNSMAIGINQAYAGNAGDLLSSDKTAQTEIWYKPLKDNGAGIALFNRHDTANNTVVVNLKDIPSLAGKTSCSCCSVWEGLCKMCEGNYSVDLVPHAADLVQIDFCN